jgi:hypothetical protein
MSESYSPTVTATCKQEYDEVSKAYYDVINITNSTGDVIVTSGLPETFMSVDILKLENQKLISYESTWVPLVGYFGSLQVTGNTRGSLFEPLKAKISNVELTSMEYKVQQAAQKDGYICLIDLTRYATIVYTNKYEPNSKLELHYFPIPINSNSPEIPESDYKIVSNPASQNMTLATANDFGLALTVDQFNAPLLWDFCKNYILVGDSKSNQQ